jgi:hypothetical protein
MKKQQFLHRLLKHWHFPRDGGRANFFQGHHRSETLILPALQMKPFKQEVATSFKAFFKATTPQPAASPQP